ncbi:MFS transporter [Neisseria weaveri]|uniref:Drug resistance translocase family protein n=2 Tax=Neisseria weaveri TaxID=28091 RepID=A0A448VQC7_9NEIS|nr:MFS transporter [Neisseria weaveri]SAY50465.1 Drug resistance translocase family protein [Neisseria weaveri]VEJ51874.1 Drug resistance translocase family protein [Neisseria weaveri]
MARNNRIQMFPEEWRASTSLSAVYALRMLGMFLVLPVLALYVASLPGVDGNKQIVGWTLGAYGVTQALLQIPLGLASDKFGRKKVIFAGLVVFAIGSFMAALAESWQMLLLARIIQGAGAISAAVTALVADLTRDEVRTRAMSMIGLTIGLTFSVSLVLSPILYDWIGVPGLFTLMGILTVLSMAVVGWITPNPKESRMHEDAEAQPGRIGEVLTNGQLLSLDFGIFALHAAQMALFTSLPFALVELGLLENQHWKVYLPSTIIGLVVMVPLIIIGETRNKLKQVFIGGISCIAVAQIALMFGLDSLSVILACLIVYFVGFNILEASLPSMVSKIAPADLKGTAMGVYNTLQSVGLVTGGVAGGYLLQHYGFGGVFAFCTGLMLLWLVVAWIAPAPKPVRNFAFTITQIWQNKEDALVSALRDLPAVEEIKLSTDKKTVYIKVLQKGFDPDAAEKIISGVQ